MMEPRLKMAAARFWATNRWPYFAAGLCALVLRESEQAQVGGVPTIMTSKHWVTLYHPTFVEGQTVEELGTALVHELQHLLFEHFDRCQQYDPMIRNLAGDCEINDGLGREGTLPKQAVYPSTFKLPDDELQEFYAEKLDQQTLKIPAVGIGHGQCGSCAGQPGQDGEESDKENLKPVHGDLIRNEVARNILDAARQAGTMPAGLERWASQRLKPKVDWRAALRASIRGAVQYTMGSDDYVWTRPNRRQAAYGTVRHPAMRAPLPSVGILVDTSGSMSDTDLSRAMTETQAVLDTLGVPVRFWSCDTEVTGGHEIRSHHQARLKGGGGTDMVEGIRAVLESKPRPDVLIVITDGYTPWPEHRPPLAALIVVKTQREGISPEWARTIEVVD